MVFDTINIFNCSQAAMFDPWTFLIFKAFLGLMPFILCHLILPSPIPTHICDVIVVNWGEIKSYFCHLTTLPPPLPIHPALWLTSCYKVVKCYFKMLMCYCFTFVTSSNIFSIKFLLFLSPLTLLRPYFLKKVTDYVLTLLLF